MKQKIDWRFKTRPGEKNHRWNMPSLTNTIEVCVRCGINRRRTCLRRNKRRETQILYRTHLSTSWSRKRPDCVHALGIRT